MDVDRAREVGRAAIVEPVVVREPRVWLGDRDEVAGAFVVDAVRAPCRGRRAPARRRASSRPARARVDASTDRSRRRARPDDRRRRTPRSRRRRAARGRSSSRTASEPVLAQDAIEVHRRRDGAQPVLGQDDRPVRRGLVERDQIAADLVDPAGCRRLQRDRSGRRAAGCSRGAAGRRASASA